MRSTAVSRVRRGAGCSTTAIALGAGATFTTTLQFQITNRGGIAPADGLTFVNPVIGLVLGVMLGGEVVNSFEWAAAGVVCAGVVLLLLVGARRA